MTLPVTTTYPYTCDGKILLNYVDCTGSTTKCTSIVMTGCENVCSLTLKTTKPLRLTNLGVSVSVSPDYSIFPFIDCASPTASCTNTITDVLEFYVDCTGNQVQCENTVSTATYAASTHFIHYNDPSYTSVYSIIDCTSASTCDNTIKYHAPIQIKCDQTTTSCTNLLQTCTAFVATINSIGYRFYPQVDG